MKKPKAKPGTKKPRVIEKTVFLSPQRVKALREVAKSAQEKKEAASAVGPKKLRVISSAMGGNIAISEFLKPICDKLGLEFVRMSEWVKNGTPQHEVLWRRETWLKELSESDIVVCVARVEEQPAKSANRAVQAMALGKPVVASPLPAYLEAIEHGKTGLIARTPEEWESCLMALKHAEYRKQLGDAAKASVEAYSMAKIGATWKDLLARLAFENCQPPKVDIIIPTFNNLEYLKVCVESIRRNTDWPHNIIVVASGNDDGTFDWVKKQPDIIHALSHERMHFSKANNEGLKVAKEKYVCFLNDDTIVGRGWLSALMQEAMKPKVGAVGPFSNCDRNWLHDEDIVVAGRHLVPAMKLEDLRDVVGEISLYSHPKVVVRRKWVAFYCTLIPREAIDRIGPLDEGFLSGDEDLDYCKRLVDAGYDIRQTYDSWVFHFGGKTRKKAEDKNHDLHHEEDRRNHAYFIKKWGSLPGGQEFKNVSTGPGVSSAPAVAAAPAAASADPTGVPASDLLISKTRAPAQDARPLFGIYTGQAWEPWTPESLEEGGIGGSETATIYTARAFAKKGFRSVVFGDCEGREGVYEGVEYVHYPTFDQFIRNHTFQFFVSSRRADVFGHPIQAERKACVVHDIWLSPDPDANLWTDRVDKFFVLSPWHREFFLNHHRKADRTKTVVSRDGVDLERFKTPRPRERGRMVYSSSPDRGLDVLLECLPRIRKEVPETSVHVFYGFSNWEKFLRQRSAQGNARAGEIEWMEAIKAKLDDPGVVYRGRIGQTQLAREIQKAEIWAQPTYFTETFCITAAENMAAGNPIVTSNLAGLNSTVGPAGILLDGDPRSRDYQDRFVGEVVRMLTDRARWEEYSRRSLEKAKLYSWDGIADEWLALVGLAAPK